MPNPSLPPRHALPRDITVPMVPGMGFAWYDRGAKYWRRRVTMSLFWLVLLGLIVLVEVGIYGSIRHSSRGAFTLLLALDVVLTVATLLFFAVRTAQRWNSPAIPGRTRIPTFAEGRTGLAAALLQIAWLLAAVAGAIVYLFCPAFFIAMFVFSLMPQTLSERRARLWIAERLREKGVAV